MAKGTLTVRIVGDPGPLQNTLKGLGGKVKRFAKVAAAAGAAAAVGFGVKALKAASDLNETLSKTQEVFGGAADQVTGFADDMADAFGLPKQEMLDAASNIGLVAKASGLSEDAAAGMSTEMAQLAADASSFFNVPLPQALEKIRSGLVGEAEPLRSFGVLLSAAAVESKAVEMGIAAAGEELTEQQKVMARSAIITDQMSEASGDLEKTQGSLANRVKALKGRFENFAAEFGMRLLPFAQRGLDIFERLMDVFKIFGRIIHSAVTKNTSEAHKAFLELDPALWGVAQVVWDLVGSVRDAWPEIKELGLQAFDLAKTVSRRLLPILGDVVTKGFKFVATSVRTLIDHKETLIPLVAGVAATYATYRGITGTINAVKAATAAWKAATLALNTTLLANPLVLVAALVVGLTAAFITAWKTSETFRNTVRRAWQGIRNATATMVDAVGAGVQGMVDAFLSNVGHIIEGAADAFGWVPGIGPKLRQASEDFQRFRNRVNREIGKVRKNVDISIRGHTNVFAMLNEIQRRVGRPVASRGSSGQQVGTGLSEFQHGGLFQPRSPVLGIIGEGPHREVAAPEPMLRQVVREESGSGQPIVVKVMLNEQQLGEALVSVNRRRRKRGLAVVG